MPENSPVRILIVADRPAAAEDLKAEILRDEPSEFQVSVHAVDELPPQLDLIIVRHAEIPSAVNDETLGIVRIATPGDADVELPEDVDAAQLCRTCRLLAEIVRLRRLQSHGEVVRRRLFSQTQTDPLTGLGNRRAWKAALESMADGTLPRDALLCVAILDLDAFKAINTAHGLLRGDDVLRTTAAAIREGVRDTDVAVRLGGDEFGLILQVPSHEVAAKIVQRVRQRISEALEANDLPRVTASAGLHVVAGDTLETAVERADLALRQAKQGGRDRTAVM